MVKPGNVSAGASNTEFAHLTRMLHCEEGGHQPAQARANQRPAGFSPQDRFQLLHALRQAAGEIGGKHAGKDAAQYGGLIGLAAAVRTMDEKEAGGFNHRFIIQRIAGFWRNALSQYSIVLYYP